MKESCARDKYILVSIVVVVVVVFVVVKPFQIVVFDSDLTKYTDDLGLFVSVVAVGEFVVEKVVVAEFAVVFVVVGVDLVVFVVVA